jgi:hypothetical protein
MKKYGKPGAGKYGKLAWREIRELKHTRIQFLLAVGRGKLEENIVLYMVGMDAV